MSDQVTEAPTETLPESSVPLVAEQPQRQIDALEPVSVAKKTILVSEIYLCSQGEGPLLGTPSVLIRTSLCNLRCRWADPKTGKFNLCDTPFTSWNPDLNNPMTTQQIYDKVVLLALKNEDGTDRKHPVTHAIISGGEPTLWGTDLAELSLGLLATGFHITIETNGTKYVEILSRQTGKDGKPLDLTGNILFSISPKLASSTPTGSPYEKEHEKTRLNYHVLEALLKRYPSYLKFVTTGLEDLKEIKEIQRKLHLPPNRIFLMPEGITRDEIVERGPAVNELCLENGYRYSPREHITLYNNKRKT